MITKDPEKKANEFLKELMGNDKYKELKDNGKVEIKYGKFVYELHSSGNIINKTLNQKYCVIPSKDSISYPPSDILAIKWMYLNYNNDIVEKVANRTNLNEIGCEVLRTSLFQNQRTETATYIDLVHYMESDGWRREEIQIGERSTNLITIYDVYYSENKTIMRTPYKQKLLDIRCPAGQQITVKGTSQVDINRGEDIRDAYRFNLIMKDDEGKEIDKRTRITVEKVSPNGVITSLWSLYGLLSESFRWERGFILRDEEILRVSIIPTCKIKSKDVKVLMDVDVWRLG